ncbi:MAG TPA: hypothetical protein DDW42_03235 [Desulfobacteraceae bacterium]|nr:hypothetical protein [Desulfobacteraceae bacterium]
MLEINYSLLIQIVNFLFLLFLMNIILYRPIRRILNQRNEEANALEKDIQDYQSLSGEKEKDIEESMAMAQKGGYSEKETLKGQGREEERAILLEAGSSAEKKLGNAKLETNARIVDVRKTLEEQVSVFSKELAEKILGRSIQ